MSAVVSLRAAFANALVHLFRRYPLCSGLGTLANHRAMRAMVTATGEQEAHLRAGPAILVDTRDYVGRAVYTFGDLDPKITWVCRTVVRNGDTVLDIGANCGVVSLACARWVGPAGAVHAFEPQPGLAAMIRGSAARNGFRNVHVHAVALAEADGEGELTIGYGNAGTATLVPLAEQNGSHWRLRVRCVAAQHYLAEHCGGPIRLAKLDVEGFELPILRAADQYFRDNPPDVVVFESNAGRGDAVDAVTEHLETLGYLVYVLPRVMLRPRLCPVTRARRVKSHDRVAIHPRAGDYADLLRALRAD